jgi:hypothetical protein
MRETSGTTSLSSSNRFPLSSVVRVASPVMFPPGRARLATSPVLTGSLLTGITMDDTPAFFIAHISFWALFITPIEVKKSVILQA